MVFLWPGSEICNFFFSNDNYFPIFSIRSRILPEKLKKANNDRTFISHL